METKPLFTWECTRLIQPVFKLFMKGKPSTSTGPRYPCAVRMQPAPAVPGTAQASKPIDPHSAFLKYGKDITARLTCPWSRQKAHGDSVVSCRGLQTRTCPSEAIALTKTKDVTSVPLIAVPKWGMAEFVSHHQASATTATQQELQMLRRCHSRAV